MNLSDLKLFIQIAHTGSITASAKHMGVTTAAASSGLKRLEQQLGAPLFIRSTRKLQITAAGEKFLCHCLQAIEALERGVVSVHETLGSIKGELKLSVPSDLGRNRLLPWLDELMLLHPDLVIDLTVSDSLSDLFSNQVHVALRYGEPLDLNMIAFHIGSLKRVTCASAKYLAHNLEPKHPQDLKEHQCLLYRTKGRLFNHWIYEQGEQNFNIKVRGSRSCDDTDIVRRWAISGHGIIYRSQLDVVSDLESGQLVPILTAFTSPPVELYLLCPSRNQVTPAVIALREMLRNKLLEVGGTDSSHNTW